MTTNLGAKAYGETGKMGFAASPSAESADANARIEEALRRHFRPEFLNRVDEIVCFRPLTKEDLKRIAALLLSAVTDRIESTGVLIEFDDSVLEAIVTHEHAREYGARPLRRAITRLIETPYSEEIISGRIKKGDFVLATYANGKVCFEKSEV